MDEPTRQRLKPHWLSLAVVVACALMTLWAWHKWDQAWVERSEGFFPPEWQNEDLETLAWKYPIYRSNDTYQWVHIADALSEGNTIPLHHRFDEGPPEGRPNRWHSGLAYVLSGTGSLVAAVNDWPVKRGIHCTAHWLGSTIHILALGLGCFLIARLTRARIAVIFAGLYFFNAAIAWDFAFSRLDHEAVYQFFFLLALIGLAAFHLKTDEKTSWALLAGVSLGFCWWISATVTAAISILVTIGLSAESLRLHKESEDIKEPARKALMIWGIASAGTLLFLCMIDGRLFQGPSIATIHPIFILAQLGAALLPVALLFANSTKRWTLSALALLCGLSPAVWLLAYGAEAHPWLDPMMRRLHDFIVEFQSPFTNGLWSTKEPLHAFLIAALALSFLTSFRKRGTLLLGSIVLGLVIVACIQTRWIGLLGTVSVLSVCLLLTGQQPIRQYLSYALIALFAGSWAVGWNKIETNPGRIFVTDLMLQVGARDINLNLQRLANGQTIDVAMPYAFAATSALFPEVRPLGTFYWENAQSSQAAADFFADLPNEIAVDFAVVQGGRQGAPFAKLTNWVAKKDISPASIESGLAWQLSSQPNPEGWAATPFHGTFPEAQLSVRIFRPR